MVLWNATWYQTLGGVMDTRKDSKKSHCLRIRRLRLDNHVPGPRRIHKIYHRSKSEKSECVIKYQLEIFI